MARRSFGRLGFFLAQTVANTAALKQLRSNTDLAKGLVMRVEAVDFIVEDYAAILQTADCDSRFTLTNGEAFGSANLGDPGVIGQVLRGYPGIAASTTSYVINEGGRITFPSDTFITEPLLGLALESTNLSAVISVYGVVTYEMVKMSEIEATQLAIS